MARTKLEAGTEKVPKKPLSSLAKRFGGLGFRPASQVLTSVLAVPTRFVQVDYATRVWGWPIQRAAVIHGPSNEGKTAFAIGLCGSFIEAGGMAKYDDAERTTTGDWCRDLLGKEVAESDRFIASRPPSYEKAVDEARSFHRAVADARQEGDLPDHASAVHIIDSLRKLVPEDILEKIRKSGASGKEGHVDGMGGRAAQIRAALNAAWLDELIPILDTCKTAWVAIARESEDPEADVWDRKFGNDYKVQGGKAIVYDAALRCRIERAGWIYIEREGKKVVAGERHRVTVLKTKVGVKEGRASVAYFHTSNGLLCPAGYDRARDVAELAVQFGIVSQESSGTSWKGQKWRSFDRFLEALHGADGERETLEAEVRAQFTARAEKDEEEDGNDEA
jgi:RecA/RadA recombinase